VKANPTSRSARSRSDRDVARALNAASRRNARGS
jgi:hypothetical protein